MTRKIFISYRRDDAKAEARSIYQHLERSYGRDSLFMDVDSIQKGLDFTQVLGKSLADTAVMLVVMGRTWLHQQDDTGRRRLDDPADYVRLEIATALRSNIPVIPVRVDGARLPRTEELPPDLQPLARRQGTVITHESFDSDVRGLAEDLRKLLPVAKGESRAPIAIAAVFSLLVAGGAAALLWQTFKAQPQAALSPTTQSGTTTPAKPAAPANQATTAGQSSTIRASVGWAEAQRSHTFQGYRDFLRAYPDAERRKDAADAAIPLLVAQIERKLEQAVADAKRGDGTLNAYIAGSDPRAMAMCIEWAGTSYDSFIVQGWGSSVSQPGPKNTITLEDRDKTALAFCSNNAPAGQGCTCEVVHRNGKSALKIPQEWIARQLR